MVDFCDGRLFFQSATSKSTGGKEKLTNDKYVSSKKTVSSQRKNVPYYHLRALEEAGFGTIDRLPFSIRVLLESVLRQVDGHVIKEEHVKNLAKWGQKDGDNVDVPFKPSRVILQDFTGVPAV